MKRPEFVTFTGIDAETDIERAAALSRQYPIEFGVLFSQSRQGEDNRYPLGDGLSRIAWSGLTLAAHVCGSWARKAMDGEDLRGVPMDLGVARRIQVNHVKPVAAAVRKFAKGWGCRGIAQSRSLEYPHDTQVDWLFDCSGGRGVPQSQWPRHPGGSRLVGYAGGICPDNVSRVIREIAATGPYWIDMESGVRTDDWFDLDKVEAVCRAVFAEEAHEAATKAGAVARPDRSRPQADHSRPVTFSFRSFI